MFLLCLPRTFLLFLFALKDIEKMTKHKKVKATRRRTLNREEWEGKSIFEMVSGTFCQLEC